MTDSIFGSMTTKTIKRFVVTKKLYWLLFIFLVFLTSCASGRHETFLESGYAVASWYGPDFHGMPTASGEIFDMYARTCAHKGYPFGTKLKVINVSNNKGVNCLVNDRGPFVAGRDLDLSYAAAKEIGLIGQGTGKVRIEYMGRDNSYIRGVRYISNTGPFAIQVGSFKELSNAVRLKTALELEYSRVYITEIEIDGSKFYRVRIGKFNMKDDVYQLAKRLANEGYSVLITSYDDKI
jgi:rare lipoprotein A